MIQENALKTLIHSRVDNSQVVNNHVNNNGAAEIVQSQETRVPNNINELAKAAESSQAQPQSESQETQQTQLSQQAQNISSAYREQTGSEMNPRLAEYFAQPAANESQPPPLLASTGLTYGSHPVGHEGIDTSNTGKELVAANIQTSEKAFELTKGGVGNAFVGAWQEEVAQAATLNGGLGDSENGFLAWSESGFIRLRNPGLTPEQNRRNAEISLTMGIAVEKLPARASETSFKEPKIDKWVNEFIEEYDTKMNLFLQDPTEDISIKDGKRRYVLKIDEKSGTPVSYYYKKESGFSGFVQKHMKIISPVVNAVGAVFAPVTLGASLGIAAAVDTGLKYAAYGKAALKNLGSTIGNALAPYTMGISAVVGGIIDKGKIGLSSIIDGATSFIGSKLGLSGTSQAILKTAGNAVGELAETGKVSAQNIASGILSVIPNVSDNPAINQTLREAIKVGSVAIDTGKISAENVLGVLNPVLEGSLPDGIYNPEAFEKIAKGIDTGEISTQEIWSVLQPIIQKSEFEGKDVVTKGLEIAAEVFEDGKLSAGDLLKGLEVAFPDLFKK